MARKPPPNEEGAFNSPVIRQLERVSPLTRKEFVDGVNDHLAAEPRRLTALARLLQIYAVKRRKLPPTAGSTEGSERPRDDGGSWTQVYREVGRFLAELTRPKLSDGLPRLVTHSSPDTFRNFLIGNSDNASDTDTYGLLGLFLIHVMVSHPELAHEVRITKEDLDLLNELTGVWQWLLTDPQPGKSPLSEYVAATLKPVGTEPMDEDVENMRQYVARFFNFPQERRDLLHRAFDRMKCGDKGYAHLICYRPQLSRPARLVKSFLVLIPPGQAPYHSGLKRNYTFAHFYKFDPRSTDIRRSVGIVMPMASGLYLVGGQQTIGSGGFSASDSFRTLKVIAIPWLPIEQGRTIIPGLVMSANRGEHHVVSRFALRRTQLTHHTAVNIGGMDLAALGGDLDRVEKLEATGGRTIDALLGNGTKLAAEEGSRQKQGIQLSERVGFEVQEILKAVNNVPPFDVSDFFVAGTGEPVRRSGVEERLSKAFRDGDPLVNKKGEVLAWSDLRFGAIDTVL